MAPHRRKGSVFFQVDGGTIARVSWFRSAASHLSADPEWRFLWLVLFAGIRRMLTNVSFKLIIVNMYIPRDLTSRLLESRSLVQILTGPRQCGKSTLLSHLSDSSYTEITFDDLQMRTLANRDPGLFLDQFKPPLLLDEVQYVPNLFPEIKARVDRLKRERLEKNRELSPIFRMTGSNQILMDRNIKESLAGRASYFYLSRNNA